MFKLKPSINVWALLFFYYSYATTALQPSSLEAQSGGGGEPSSWDERRPRRQPLNVREAQINRPFTAHRHSDLVWNHTAGATGHTYGAAVPGARWHMGLYCCTQWEFNRRSQASGFGFGVHMSHKTWNDFVGLPVSFDYLVLSTEKTEATVRFNI